MGASCRARGKAGGQRNGSRCHCKENVTKLLLWRSLTWKAGPQSKGCSADTGWQFVTLKGQFPAPLPGSPKQAVFSCHFCYVFGAVES